VSNPKTCSTAHSLTIEHTAYLCDRSEASTIPKLLVANPEVDNNELDRSMYTSGRGDHRAVYHDGTWVAVDPDASLQTEDHWSEDSADLDPQEQYYRSLLRRYEALRVTLANADPKELAALVEANPSQYTNIQPPSSRKAWLSTLDRDFPTPARVVHINEWNTFCALQYCAETLDRYETISKQKSCWIWTLLALAGEKGTLDYYRAGRIRDLGHKAGQLSVLLHSGARPRPPSDDEYEDVEEWHADGEGTDGEDEQQDAESKISTTGNGIVTQVPPDAEEHELDEEGEVIELPGHDQAGTESIGAQVDGTDEREADVHSQPNQTNSDSDDSADMSMSDDEGEIQEDDEAEVRDGCAGLEEARARLLAQLGDRLVQPSVPPPKGPRPGSQLQSASRHGPRHRHNGKVCHDSTCRATDRPRKDGSSGNASQAGQQKESPGSRPAQPPAKVYASRAEAELQRQKMRDDILAKAKLSDGPDHGDASATSASVPGETISSPKNSKGMSRAQASSNFQGGAGHGTKGKSEEDSSDNVDETIPVDINTRVTIDMILTVVAECYGQRDLLHYREPW
jgi:hypothetical protein